MGGGSRTGLRGMSFQFSEHACIEEVWANYGDMDAVIFVALTLFEICQKRSTRDAKLALWPALRAWCTLVFSVIAHRDSCCQLWFHSSLRSQHEQERRNIVDNCMVHVR